MGRSTVTWEKILSRFPCRTSRLLELVDREVLENILKAFTGATGLRTNVVDPEGQWVLSSMKPEENCKFCRLIWQYQDGLERCQGSYMRAGKQAAQFGEPYIFRCPAGLIAWAAPIIINSEYLGSIICGQVLMWEPEDFFWIELEEMNRCLGADLSELMEAVQELEVMSVEKVQAAADLLFVTANYIMKAGWENLRHRQEISRHQSMLANEIAARKALEAELKANRTNLDMYLHKERALMSKVRLGDFKGAEKLLQELLVDIFVVGKAKIPVIKARVMELVVILSRSAVEGGADFNRVLTINTGLLQKISQAGMVEEIALVADQGLHKYMDSILKNDQVKNPQLINQVKTFIREHFKESLTLEEIANAVFLSPCYLSRIFKCEQGITVMDYVTKVRMEEAKRLLHKPEYNIVEISSRLGFSDPSHFSKVFRRNEGMTPREYRQQA